MYDEDEAPAWSRKRRAYSVDAGGQNMRAAPTGSACGTSFHSGQGGTVAVSRTREFVQSHSPHGLGLVQLLGASG